MTSPMKRCAQCHEEKPRDAFGRHKKRKDGLRSYCRTCESANRSAYYRANREKEIARTTQWAREHPEGGRDYQRRWREAHKGDIQERKRQEYAESGEKIREKLRDVAYRRKYGISLAERDAMAERQSHRCAICGVAEADLPKRLAVDHDHKTDAVRELLCQNCNHGLGHFRDSPDLLERAAEYVRRHT